MKGCIGLFDEKSLFALLLSGIAGFSTLLGALVVVFTTKKNEKMVTASLGFAAGVMICVSFTDLYPNGKNLLVDILGKPFGVTVAVVSLLSGLLIAGMLDRFVPHSEYDECTGDKPHKNLFRVGFISTMAIGLHNFPEGIATFMAGYEDVALGISIAVAISLHNIPEGITVAMPIFYATGSRKKAFKYCFLSGIAEPLGAILAFLVLRPFINDVVLGGIFCLLSGVMIYICIEELIPSSRQYGHDRIALYSTFGGILIMLFSHVI